ncbi:hypothetical protein P6144_15415 [Sphingomonas sp. HITSZ_GF]|uniref:hypothetical protein n=1 Tax=Sphingomonas sp. HITSZ_GF TaxID=3037247 RepID=UPI00240D3CBE|nr:hypothetical protein [Sphingomonas sp. HITSZ_GF]MDG2535048.1 hypothetical protein [Sphingomonas sp. HITSZ_GF]
MEHRFVPIRLRIPLIPAMKVLEAASYLGGLVSLVLIVIQLRADAAQRRTQTAFEFVRQFGNSPMSDHRAVLLRMWLPYSDQLAVINQQGMPEKEIAALIELVLTEVDKQTSPNGVVAIHEIADFYDQLLICEESGACDPKVIRNYFSSYGHSFRCLYQKVVEAQAAATGAPDLGKGIREIGGSAPCTRAG